MMGKLLDTIVVRCCGDSKQLPLHWRCYKWSRTTFWGVALRVIPLSFPILAVALTKNLKEGAVGWVDEVRNFLQSNPRLLLVFVSWTIFEGLLKAFVPWADKQLSRLESAARLNSEEMAELLTLIDEVVAHKMDSVGEVVKKRVSRKRKGQNPGERWMWKVIQTTLFKEGDPHKTQMIRLLEAAHSIFSMVIEGETKDVKAVLGTVRNNRLEDFIVFCPAGERPRHKLNDLRDSKSGFSIACENNRLHIVPETHKSVGDGFVCNGTPQEGSLIVYPIFHRNLQQVVMVVSIYAAKPGVFVEAKRARYNYILETIGKRFLLEFNQAIVRGGQT